jgi:hypothetical protein
MKMLPLLALLTLPLLAGCSASVTTFSASIRSPAGQDAQAFCEAEVLGRGVTREISLDGAGPTIYQRQMKLCLNRYGFEPEGAPAGY